MVFEDSPRSGSSDLEAETSELAQPAGDGRCLVAVGGVVVSTVTLPQYGGRSRSRRGWRRCEDESRITNRPKTFDPRGVVLALALRRCPDIGSTNQSMKATGRLSVSLVREHHGVHGIFTHLDLKLVMSCQKRRWRGA